jgi:nitric oxide reductase subunit B
VIGFFYLAAQKARGDVYMSGNVASAWKWKWSIALLWIGMTVALLIAGYERSRIERAVGGSTWAAYFAAQSQPWFIQAMNWRQISGWAFCAGYLLLVWDLLTIGKRETRPAVERVFAEAHA